ncbi:MAG: hypothetical protein DDT21_01883 [Syntrophomonadaceae bacterium]|nr:hypothetical protein [Bacillota bacterium]
MYITSATVTYGRNVQLRQYHNFHPEITLTANLEDGDELDEVFALLWEKAKTEVQREILYLVDAYKAKEQKGTG